MAFYMIIYPLKTKLKKSALYIMFFSVCALLYFALFNVKHISKNELIHLTWTDAAYFIDYCGSCDLFDYYTCFLIKLKVCSSECTINPDDQFKFDNFKTRKKVEFNPFTDYFMTK